MSILRTLLPLLLFATIVVWVGPAAAQEKSNRELAQETFNEGAKAYLAGDYSEAVVKFLTAFEYEENAMILYNLSLAYAGMENWERAIEAAERAATRDDLPEKARPRNRARIVSLERIVQATDTAAAIAERRKRASEVDVGLVDSEPQTETSALSGLGWAGIGAATVGVGLLVWAAILDRDVQERIDAFEQNPTLAERDALSGDQTTGKIVLFSGVGLATIGAALLGFDLFSSGETQASIAPTRGGARVGLKVRF
jgi:tetratricopeptide (TPR) repeat protein